MASYTRAYTDYLERIEEVKLLCGRAAKLERSRDSVLHGNDISALCRSSVVLLSSHIEGYVRELGEQTLDRIVERRVSGSRLAPRFYYYTSRASIEEIRSTTEPDRIAEKVFSFSQGDHKYWDDTSDFIHSIDARVFSHGFANPKFEKIKKYLNRFGYEDYRRDFFGALGPRGNIVSSAIDHIVDTRNSIAHGDRNVTKTPGEIKVMIEEAKLFCRTTDRVFGKWCARNICAIR